MTLHPTCVPTHPFLELLSSYLSTCIPTPMSLLSTLFGLASMTAWLFSQLPQIVKNHRSKSVDGLSPIFLLNWLLGDVCNFLGAVILRQMIFQQVIGGYYVIVDICLMSQFLWYSVMQPIMEARRRRGKGKNVDAFYGVVAGEAVDETDDEDSGDELFVGGRTKAMVIEGLSPPMSGLSSVASSYIPSSSSYSKSGKPYYLGDEAKNSRRYARYGSSYGSSSFVGTPGAGKSAQMMFMFALMVAIATAFPERKVGGASRALPQAEAVTVGAPLSTSSSSSSQQVDPTVLVAASAGITIEVFGKILSWVSTALYCTSRIPQLYKNYSRRSTSGLSILLFIAAFFGNLFYSLSLLTNPLAWNDFGPYGGGGLAGPQGSLRSEWWGNTLPFFLGASGVLCQDAMVFVQWLWYGESKGVDGDGETVNGGVAGTVGEEKKVSVERRKEDVAPGQQRQGARRFLLASHAGGFLVGTPPGMGYGTVFAR